MTPWKRKEIIGDCTLYLGDCLEVLPHLPKVDALVTDPPYGVLDEDWDDFSVPELVRFTAAWSSRCAMLTETAVIFTGERTRSAVEPLFSMLWDRVRHLVWNKRTGSVAEDRLFYAFETIFLCRKQDTWTVAQPKSLEVASVIARAREAKKLSRGAVDMAIRGKKTGLCFRWEEGACLPSEDVEDALIAVLDLGDDFKSALTEARLAKDEVLSAARNEASARAANFGDVFTYPPPASRQHPTQKPVGLMTDLMLALGDPGTVLDPFMGSGTTGVAAMKRGVSFIGIEREPKYFEVAMDRLRKAHAQPDMFIRNAPKPVQEAMF